MNPDCEHIQSMLGAYIDGELSDGDVSRVVEHLETCADCRRVHEDFLGIDGLYAEIRTEELTDGQWKKMLWNVLPRRQGHSLTAGPRRIPLSIETGERLRWPGVFAGVLAAAGAVLVAVVMIISGPVEQIDDTDYTLAEDNTCGVIEVESTTVGYETSVRFPRDAGDLLVIDIECVNGEQPVGSI